MWQWLGPKAIAEDLIKSLGSCARVFGCCERFFEFDDVIFVLLDSILEYGKTTTTLAEMPFSITVLPKVDHLVAIEYRRVSPTLVVGFFWLFVRAHAVLPTKFGLIVLLLTIVLV